MIALPFRVDLQNSPIGTILALAFERERRDLAHGEVENLLL